MKSSEFVEFNGDVSLAVIFPTRNNESEIEAHFRMAKRFLHLATEVIVVDSSSDKTLDLCRRCLPQSTKIIKHPPGLYESWNAAINAVKSDYIYISTIGDSIEPSFLETMLELCKSNNLDLLISPPRLIDAPKKTGWPIHEIVSEFNLSSLIIPNQFELVLLNFYVLSQYGLCSLSGSLASNVMRAETAKRNPFPPEFGGGGDVMWFAKNCANMRVGIVPKCGSTFMVHTSNHQKFSVEHYDLWWLQAISYLFESNTDLANTLDYELIKKHHTCKMILKELRKSSPGSFNHTVKKAKKWLLKRYLSVLMYVELAKIKKLLSAALSSRP